MGTEFAHTLQQTQQAAVETVSYSKRIEPEERSDGSVNQQSHEASFWNACGILHILYLHKDRTIYGEYNTNPLDRFNDNLRK